MKDKDISPRVEDSHTEEEFEDLLAAAEENAVSGWEMEFPSDMRIRFFTHKDKMVISLVCDGSKPELPFGFVCFRCGARHNLPRRLFIDTWIKYFAKLHRKCQQPEDLRGTIL